jgi:hypothetical protein
VCLWQTKQNNPIQTKSNQIEGKQKENQTKSNCPILNQTYLQIPDLLLSFQWFQPKNAQ